MTLSSLLLSLMLLLLLSCKCVIAESPIDASDFTVAAAAEPPTDKEQLSDWKSSKLKVNDESKLSSVSEDSDAAAVVNYLDDRDSVKSSARALSDHAIDADNVDEANADSNGNIFTVNQRFRGLRGGFFGRGFGFRRGLGFFGRGRRFRRFGFGRGLFGFGGFRRFPFFPFRRFGFGLGGFLPGFGLGFGAGLAAYCPFLWDPLAACAYCGICY